MYTVAFAPDGKTLAAASTDNVTRLWDVATPAGAPAPAGKPLTGLRKYAIGLAFSPDCKLLAVGSADKTVHLWNVTDPAHPVPAGAPLTGPARYVWALAFSPDGKTLAAGVTDGTVWLWNVAARQPVADRDADRPAGHIYSSRSPRPGASWPPPAMTAPCTSGTPTPPRRRRPSAPTSGSR